jgi:peptidoglycan/xylan/chitin deacetylase (PgdA/CDA1 family)
MQARRILRRLTPRPLRRKTIVSLTFDDGSADHVAVARLLADRGLQATFFVNSNHVGAEPKYLDWPEVAEIAALGHEVGGHTSDHVKLDETPADEAASQITGDRRRLEARGYEVTSFAYPYGAWNETARALVADAGYTSARRAWGLAFPGARAEAVSELVPPADPFGVRTVPSFEQGVTLETMQRVVVRGELEGGWLPLVFHCIVPEGTRYDLPEDLFRDFVDWLRARTRSEVRTVGSVVAG